MIHLGSIRQVDTVVGKPNGTTFMILDRRIKELEDGDKEPISNDFYRSYIWCDSTSPKSQIQVSACDNTT